MSNTYAINTTSGKEFEVETELQAIGLKPWVPKILLSKNVKEKPRPIWYDRAYIPKLIFCVIPAIYWPDVMGIKHVHGKPFPFTARDIEGRSAGFLTHPKPNEHQYVLDDAGNPKPIRAVYGLKDFRKVVEAEYADREKLRANNDYQCQYHAGQALELIGGVFEGFPAIFRDTIHHAHDDYSKLRADVVLFGRETMIEMDPSDARAFCG